MPGRDISTAVLVSSSPVVVAPGSDVTLSCSFHYSEADDPGRVVLIWQRGQEVVHSFYYGTDQLKEQSPAYRGRTHLFPEQVAVGNASLRLREVQGSDQGTYTCAVANEQGRSQRDLQILVAAEYEEPRLVINMSKHPGLVMLEYCAQGYPQATVLWLNQSGGDITERSHTSQWESRGGLLELRSSLTVNQAANQSYTFQLSNPVLKQTIRRTVTIASGGSRVSGAMKSCLLVLLLTISRLVW
ncbi:CD276 antigen [Amia ocellicauda]|uniref:CD276 antigen n=1 Tax=Amia ocellicauda TaxID=2972642 RepID=UPI0034649950